MKEDNYLMPGVDERLRLVKVYWKLNIV